MNSCFQLFPGVSVSSELHPQVICSTVQSARCVTGGLRDQYSHRLQLLIVDVIKHQEGRLSDSVTVKADN